MPTMLPTGSPAQKPAPKRHHAEGIEIWSGCIGLAAAVLAAFIYFSGGDNIGAAMILMLAAVVVMAMLRASANAQNER
jgi:multisubunit Na+/H+ antiporter MnhG subunit